VRDSYKKTGMKESWFSILQLLLPGEKMYWKAKKGFKEILELKSESIKTGIFKQFH